MNEQAIYAMAVLVALILGLVSFALNALASRKFLEGPLKNYITLKFYGEFFMMMFLIVFLFTFISNVFNVRVPYVSTSLNLLGLVLIIVSFFYFLMGGFALKSLGDIFGFKK